MPLPVRGDGSFSPLEHAEWLLHYPHIDPVIIGYGPIAIRWYNDARGVTGVVLTD